MYKKLLGLFVLVAALSIFVVSKAQASDTFPDVPDSHWAHDFIKWLFDNGISSGFPDGTYRPDNNVTRAEIAVFLQQVALWEEAPTQLVVDYVVTLNTSLPGDCPGLAIGDVWYGEFDLFAEGTVGTGAPPLGEGKWNLVSTKGPGTCGFYGTGHYHIFGQGSIEGITTGLPWEGAIVGGTGDFAGASGEYSGIFLGGFNRVTFTLDD